VRVDYNGQKGRSSTYGAPKRSSTDITNRALETLGLLARPTGARCIALYERNTVSRTGENERENQRLDVRNLSGRINQAVARRAAGDLPDPRGMI